MKATTPVNRRNFLFQSAALLASPILLTSMTPALLSKYKMGLQLFTVREPMSKAPVETLKKVAAIGYQDLETYGFDPVGGKYYGMKAAAFRELLDSLHLTTSSGHYDFAPLFDKPVADLDRYVDLCIEGGHALGQKYITWPWLNPESRSIEKFKILTGKLNHIGERVGKGGLGFAYHNHDFEFADHNGENGYDIILAETDPALVKLQIDLYWVMHSSRLTPGELFRKQPGRFVMWHIKDMDKVSRDYSEIGNGSIDFRPILPDAALAGLQYYFIEQGGNFAKDSMQSIAESAAYFKKNLEHLLT